MDALSWIGAGRVVGADSPATPDVRALLERHVALMAAASPEESCHVLAPDELLSRDALLLTLRENGRLLGTGALAPIAGGHAEIKSMHTAEAARGTGVARAILTALMDEARSRGYTRLSLETGSDAPFAAARALYLRFGFEECPPFAGYGPDPLSTFMTKAI